MSFKIIRHLKLRQSHQAAFSPIINGHCRLIPKAKRIRSKKRRLTKVSRIMKIVKWKLSMEIIRANTTSKASENSFHYVLIRTGSRSCSQIIRYRFQHCYMLRYYSTFSFPDLQNNIP
jgi:hypothetical protein